MKYVLEAKIEELDRICKKLSENTNSIIKVINMLRPDRFFPDKN